jgi:hypothetical protein
MPQAEPRHEGGGRKSGDSNVPQCNVDRSNSRPSSALASSNLPVVVQKTWLAGGITVISQVLTPPSNKQDKANAASTVLI